MIEFIDKTSEQSGTPINRSNMMAIQGFVGATATINADGSISETNAEGHTVTAKFNADGSITQIFTGQKIITKKTYLNENTVREVIE